jgi:hypothetical protein
MTKLELIEALAKKQPHLTLKEVVSQSFSKSGTMHGF